jgi:hypothetical protein
MRAIAGELNRTIASRASGNGKSYKQSGDKVATIRQRWSDAILPKERRPERGRFQNVRFSGQTPPKLPGRIMAAR